MTAREQAQRLADAFQRPWWVAVMPNGTTITTPRVGDLSNYVSVAKILPTELSRFNP